MFPFFVAPVAVTDTPPAPPPAATAPAEPPPPPPPIRRRAEPDKPTQPIDPDTGLPIPPRDPTTGLPIELLDDTGQPIIPRDETGQIIPTAPTRPAADSLLRSQGPFGSFDPSVSAGDRPLGGSYYRLRLALLQGVSTNAVEEQDPNTNAIIQHPGLFEGLDASIDYITQTSPTDTQAIHFGVRGQHYFTFSSYGAADDGTMNLSLDRTFSVDRKTTLNLNVMGTLTSANSATLADGPLFVLDPATLTHVYTVNFVRAGITHELSRSWRVQGSILGSTGWSIHDIPVVSPGRPPASDHQGLDSVSTGALASVNHDFDPYNIGSLLVGYSFAYVPFSLDVTRNPPTLIGAQTIQAGNAAFMWNHAFTESFRSLARAGMSLSQAPEPPADQTPVVSPDVSLALTYTRDTFLAILNGSYAYGSVNPRLGFGPSEGGGFAVQGVPYPHGYWANLAVLANGYLNQSTLNYATSSTSILYAGGGAEVRLGLSTWLGVVAGYNARYIAYEVAGQAPFYRHLFFVGLSGYFANDGSLPTLQTWGVAVTPPS